MAPSPMSSSSSISFTSSSGSVYGAFDVNGVLRGEKTISRHVISVADAARAQVKELLSSSLKDHSLTICPDYWIDSHKKISYLGVSVTIVDDQYVYKSIDLCCKSFEYRKKTAENTLKVLHNCLSFYGVNSLADVNIVCDRGSNFVCAFKEFKPIFCCGHRLNNIVKLAVFQNNNNNNKRKAGGVSVNLANIPDKNSSTITSEDNKSDNHKSSSEDSASSSDDEDFGNELALTVVKRKRTFDKTAILPKNEMLVCHMDITIDRIPPAAKHILDVLNKCKNIVKYVKKAGINNDIQEEGGVTLHQSCIVRWLSMSNLLESILKSFKITKRLLIARNKQSLTIDLDKITIKQLVLVLKPLKHVMTVFQTGNLPSLHLVLLCKLRLKISLSSYKSLFEYVNTYCNPDKIDENEDEIEESEDYESEGIKRFRERLFNLIDELLVLDDRHYCATMLHPKYRFVKSCTAQERSQCHQYVRKELMVLHDEYLATNTYENPPELNQKN
ncbi:unnamed protein product [Rotaria socialis]|uniref:Uncharacterized protein n=2 Tax=Rotaria socialis TaxID=392032 RepID=A0A817MT64_9BILA|nr:unnamed protein product [Rotaria socialis]